MVDTVIKRLILVILLIFLTSCSPPTTLHDLVGGHVLLKENGVYEEYIVLNEEGWLLRSYLLDNPRVFGKSSYYEGSNIDKFLSEEFINVYDIPLVPVDIEITAKDSIGPCGKETTTIQRKVFLLSYSELDGTPSTTILKEGSPISYFTNKENRLAKYKNGEHGSWWLRTPSTAGLTVVCGVSPEGAIGSSGIYNPNPGGGYYSGVRPVICLPGDTTLVYMEGGYAIE